MKKDIPLLLTVAVFLGFIGMVENMSATPAADVLTGTAQESKSALSVAPVEINITSRVVLKDFKENPIVAADKCKHPVNSY